MTEKQSMTIDTVLADADFKLDDKEKKNLATILKNSKGLVEAIGKGVKISENETFKPSDLINSLEGSKNPENVNAILEGAQNEEQIALTIMYLKLKFPTLSGPKVSGDKSILSKMLHQVAGIGDVLPAEKPASPKDNKDNKEKDSKPKSSKPELKNDGDKLEKRSSEKQSKTHKPVESSDAMGNLMNSRDFIKKHETEIKKALEGVKSKNEGLAQIYDDIIFKTVFDKPLSKKNASDDIINLQALLNEGLPKDKQIKENGIFDQTTLNALKGSNVNPVFDTEKAPIASDKVDTAKANSIESSNNILNDLNIDSFTKSDLKNLFEFKGITGFKKLAKMDPHSPQVESLSGNKIAIGQEFKMRDFDHSYIFTARDILKRLDTANISEEQKVTVLANFLGANIGGKDKFPDPKTEKLFGTKSSEQPKPWNNPNKSNPLQERTITDEPMVGSSSQSNKGPVMENLSFDDKLDNLSKNFKLEDLGSKISLDNLKKLIKQDKSLQFALNLFKENRKGVSDIQAYSVSENLYTTARDKLTGNETRSLFFEKYGDGYLLSAKINGHNVYVFIGKEKNTGNVAVVEDENLASFYKNIIKQRYSTV